MNDDLDWFLETFKSYLWACEHEYGGDRSRYEDDEKRAENIITLVKQKISE